MPRAQVNGAELHYEDAGEGRPVVFVHGVWMSGRFFARQLPHFAERNRTIVPDLRGHGHSEKTATGHTVAQYARDVRSLLELLELRDVVLAGWSMGALVAWDYVEQFGTERLAGLVVVDQSPSDYEWPDWPFGFLSFDDLRHVMTAVQTDRETLVRESIPMMFKEPPSEAETAWMVEEITRVPEPIAGAIIFDQTLQDYRGTLPKVTVPALLCIGRDEQLVPVVAGEWMAERLPNARLEIFEQSGHCPFLEEPDRFSEVVSGWIESLGG